jgi:transcription termination/antitermination protein NusG
MDINRLHHFWFAIQVRPRHEFLTAKLLRGKGYEEFVPIYTSRRQWSDRAKQIELPLFTGYVFCRFDAEIRWPIVSTDGVIRVLGTRNGPEPIPDEEIDAIRKVRDMGLTPRPYDYFQAGDRVRITSGPLSGIEGTLISIRNRRHLILSIDLIRGSVVVDMDQCSLKQVSILPLAAPCEGVQRHC